MKYLLTVLCLLALSACSGKKEAAPAQVGPECTKTRACCADLVKAAPDVESICEKGSASTEEASCKARRKEAVELAEVKGATVPAACH
jgi:hypothetical protein